MLYNTGSDPNRMLCAILVLLFLLVIYLAVRALKWRLYTGRTTGTIREFYDSPRSHYARFVYEVDRQTYRGSTSISALYLERYPAGTKIPVQYCERHPKWYIVENL